MECVTMRIHYPGLLKAMIPSILAFILMDAVVEYSIVRVTGISFLSCFEQELQRQYDIQFHSLNFILFFGEMLFVMFFYVLIRPLFCSKFRPVVISTLFFAGFTALFLGQLVNLGIYPIKAALIFSISTLISFPVAIFIGATVYERYFVILRQKEKDDRKKED